MASNYQQHEFFYHASAELAEKVSVTHLEFNDDKGFGELQLFFNTFTYIVLVYFGGFKCNYIRCNSKDCS